MKEASEIAFGLLNRLKPVDRIDAERDLDSVRLVVRRYCPESAGCVQLTDNIASCLRAAARGQGTPPDFIFWNRTIWDRPAACLTPKGWKMQERNRRCAGN